MDIIFHFCGLFQCSCGSMMSAQWAKGHGGLYRYYSMHAQDTGCARSHMFRKIQWPPNALDNRKAAS